MFFNHNPIKYDADDLAIMPCIIGNRVGLHFKTSDQKPSTKRYLHGIICGRRYAIRRSIGSYRIEIFLFITKDIYKLDIIEEAPSNTGALRCPVVPNKKSLLIYG